MKTQYTTACLFGTMSTLLASCVSDDFNNLAEGFLPPSPRQAALMAVDQYNADDRRTGVTLLAKE